MGVWGYGSRMDAVGWMLVLFFLGGGMLANKKCWETRTNGEGGRRKKHRQSQ